MHYAGTTLVVAMMASAPLLGGWWLDEKVGTSPLFLILGIFLGSGAGFYNLYKTLVDGEEKRKKERGGTNRERKKKNTVECSDRTR